MNNLERAKEIIEEIKRMNQEHSDFNGQSMEDCGACCSIIEAEKKTAKKHIKKIKKGCGKRIGVRRRVVTNSLMCDKYQKCKDCQEALDLYKEAGIC